MTRNRYRDIDYSRFIGKSSLEVLLISFVKDDSQTIFYLERADLFHFKKSQGLIFC
ncbi:hypothetical protein FC34_GL001364 [Lacticaseibacillus brantae DSM 23927]|uniref:Uncharacterized protein n=1 Tax=Lacticaseibacillus brantae DSM 23927 TaxID=1423727 RepID=A0A0R2B5H9_9LACO|nr:hypothetical protein FC34_GL001364 [Lacticaseibacillus brantae DSM 23927]